MLDLLGVVIGLTFVIIFISKDLKKARKKKLAVGGKQPQGRDQAPAPLKLLDGLGKKAKKDLALGGKQRQVCWLPKQLDAWGKKQRLLEKDVTDSDLRVMATILSAGLVDVDPSFLQHLKDFRDLRGSSS
ncbi:hypothetical protein GN956_G21871 [Arapaima gigas]